jgi:rhodanese-related sulfurtransferase
MNAVQTALLIGVPVVALAGWVWWRGRGIIFGPNWEDIRAMVRRSFPNVPQIEPGSLASKAAGGKVVLVDCRGAREFAFSHIPEAVNCHSVEDVRRVASPSDPVVIYCVIGYRASMLAERLRRAGFRDVSSLDGAILRWANEDRPLINSEGVPMEKVSPWMKGWAKHLLKPGKY